MQNQHVKLAAQSPNVTKKPQAEVMLSRWIPLVGKTLGECTHDDLELMAAHARFMKKLVEWLRERENREGL